MPPLSNALQSADLSPVRDELLRSSYKVMVLLGAVLMAVNVARTLDTGWKPLYSIYLAAYALAVLIYVNLHRVPTAASTGMLLVLFVGAPIAGFWSWGIAGNTVPVLLGACILATTLTGTTGGLVTLATSVTLLGGITAFVHTQGYQLPFDIAQHATSTTVGGAAILTFGTMAAFVATRLARLCDWLADRILSARETRQALAAQVDDRRRAGVALRLSRARFRLALDATPDAMLMSEFDTDRVIDVNPAFERLTGLARHQVAGRANADLGIWLDASPSAVMRDAILGQQRPQQQPGRLFGADGSVRDMIVTATRIDLEDRPVLLLVARDVSAQVLTAARLRGVHQELEQRVQRRSRQLDAARRDLEGFVNSVSHDLRSPLLAIVDAERALRASLPAHAGVGGLDRLRQAAKDTGKLVDALLELSRINRRELRRENVDLSALATEAMAQLRAATPSREIEVRIEPRLHADADPALMRLVLANLLDNACKFSTRAAHSLVEFGCRRDDGGTAWFVRDNGVGFDMAYAAKLFEPFERLHAPSEFEGTGIGLATVARAVQRHGGRVWAESSPGRGATFWFRLG